MKAIEEEASEMIVLVKLNEMVKTTYCGRKSELV